MKKKWMPIQLQNALNLSKKVNFQINGISINSKTTKKSNLFLPLKGKKFDGHIYISDAFKKGASLSLVTNNGFKKYKLQRFKKRLIKVKNVLSSLQELALYSRKEIKGKVIGVTGSVGKTSIKEALFFLLKDKNKVQSSTGNYNNLIGLPLNLANFNNNAEISILEMGMNRKNEIKKLSKICKPDIGLISKVSNAHI